MHLNLLNLCRARDAEVFCKSFRKALIQRQNKIHNQSEDLFFFFREHLVLGTKIVKNLLIQSEAFFFWRTPLLETEIFVQTRMTKSL